MVWRAIVETPGLCASQVKSRPWRNSETRQTIVINFGWRIRTLLPGPKAAWSSRSICVIDAVHSGHRSTSTRTDQTLSAGLKTSTDTSIFISTPAWREATSLPSTIQGELLIPYDWKPVGTIVRDPSQDRDEFTTIWFAPAPSTCLSTDPSRFLCALRPVSELEFDGPNPDDVSISERHFRLYSRATEQSTIRATEVLQNGVSPRSVDADAGVTARHIRVIEPDIA
jgi:hypothetical protein